MKKPIYLLSLLSATCILGVQTLSSAQPLFVLDAMNAGIILNVQCEGNSATTSSVTLNSNSPQTQGYTFQNSDLQSIDCKNGENILVNYTVGGSTGSYQCSGITYNSSSTWTSEYQITLDDSSNFHCVTF